MQLYVDNIGQVIVYNWVEWLREHVQPSPLDPQYGFSISTFIQRAYRTEESRKRADFFSSFAQGEKCS